VPQGKVIVVPVGTLRCKYFIVVPVGTLRCKYFIVVPVGTLRCKYFIHAWWWSLPVPVVAGS